MLEANNTREVFVYNPEYSNYGRDLQQAALDGVDEYICEYDVFPTWEKENDLIHVNDLNGYYSGYTFRLREIGEDRFSVELL